MLAKIIERAAKLKADDDGTARDEHEGHGQAHEGTKSAKDTDDREERTRSQAVQRRVQRRPRAKKK